MTKGKARCGTFKFGKAITKSDARQQAMDFQNWASEQNLSWGEVAECHDHFKRLGKKFGLMEEFKENGII